FSFGLSILLRSPDVLSHAAAMGLAVDLCFDCRSLAHLGGMAFPRIFSLHHQLGLVGAFARAFRLNARLYRHARLPVSDHAFGMVVPVVDCAFARPAFRLAA